MFEMTHFIKSERIFKLSENSTNKLTNKKQISKRAIWLSSGQPMIYEIHHCLRKETTETNAPPNVQYSNNTAILDNGRKGQMILDKVLRRRNPKRSISLIGGQKRSANIQTPNAEIVKYFIGQSP